MELQPFARISRHDGAIVCSYETELAIPLDQTEAALSRLMTGVQTFVEERGGIVGHIKACAEEKGRVLTLSAAGGEVTTLPGTGERTEVSFAAIVFLVDEKQLQNLVEGLFEEIER